MIALQVVGAVLAAGLNIGFWFLVVRREKRLREWVARHYGVTIMTGMKGHWDVRGKLPFLKKLGIEMLQLVYYMTAFIVWAGLMILCIVAMGGP